VAGTVGGAAAALSGLERGGSRRQRLKGSVGPKNFSKRRASGRGGGGGVCLGGVVGGVGSRGWGGRRLASGGWRRSAEPSQGVKTSNR